jgi:hypothetical protein
MERHDNPLNASDQLGTTPSSSTRNEHPASEKPTPGRRAANTSQYAEAAMPAGTRLQWPMLGQREPSVTWRAPP